MSNPIRGQTRELTNKVEATVPMNIHNRFDIEVIDSRTGKIRQRAQAENVICSQLWTRLFTPASYFNYIHYGTGSGTPASTNTSLFTFYGYGTPSSTQDVFALKSADGYASYCRKIQLSESTAIGATITEVGIGYSTTSSSLCTHAMLEDANGNQISIAKTSTDIINIYATVFVHWNAAGDDNGYIKLIPSGSSKGSGGTTPLNGFLGMLLGAYSTVAFSPNVAQPLAGESMASQLLRTASTLTSSYSLTNKTITISAARFSANSFNYGGARGILLTVYNSDNPAYFYPAIWLSVGGAWFQYSSVTSEAIGTGDGSAKDFATAFPCPNTATVYLNGVAQSNGVSVAAEPILVNDLGQYFDGLDASSTTINHILAPLPTPSTIKYKSLTSGNSYIYYNPNYSFGVSALYRYNCTISVSNDLLTWTQIASSGDGTINVDVAYQNYKYWKFTATGTGYVQAITAPSAYLGRPIHFVTAPASGAVITADYRTPTIAKDANHVFDLTVTIQLGEYTS